MGDGKKDKSGGLYRGVNIPVKILDIFILAGTVALVVLFVLLVVFAGR